jgi:DNA-binding transcriptional regulator YhcF (GntR family)
MSKWRNKDGKTVKRNIVASQFGSRPLELMESPALRVLSRAAHLALLRIEIELRKHGGRDNGKLPVTKQNFVEFGIHPNAVAAALRELEALGLIRITQRGRGGNAEHRQPNKFLLNFMCGAIDTRDEITDAWKMITTMEEAEQIACTARAAKDPDKVAYGCRTYRRRRVRKPYLVSGTETMLETAKSPGTETVPTVPGTETILTIDTLGREASVARQPDLP